MFKLPFSGIEGAFAKNKAYSREIIQEYSSNVELYGTQVTVSFADRLGIFLANYPSLVEKIQSLIFQDLSEEEIIRKTIINLLNKEFGDFETSELIKISIAAIISITSRCKIDYPFEVIDIAFNKTDKLIKLQFSPLITFLDQKAIILVFCSLSYILEELHINEVFQYQTEDIETILIHLNQIEKSSLWNKEELMYQFLIRLNFLIDVVDSNTGTVNYDLLMYILKAFFTEIDYFKEICNYFALNRWDVLFKQQKNYEFSVDTSSPNFLLTIKPFYPILSNKSGTGFRLVSGRARNIGFGTVGINPVLITLLKFLSIGDQVKLDYPFNNYQVQVVDSIEGPYVQLENKNCMRINSLEILSNLPGKIDRILTLGDLLIDELDIPTGFNRNHLATNHFSWVHEALLSLQNLTEETSKPLYELFNINESLQDEQSYTSFFKKFLLNNEKKITAFITVELYKLFKIPIHPKWSPRWNKLSNKDWRMFRIWIKKTRYWEAGEFSNRFHQIEGPVDELVLRILQMAEITYSILQEKIIIQDAGSVLYFIFLDPDNDLGEVEPAGSLFNPIHFLNNSTKVKFYIEDKYRLSSSLNSINTYYIDNIKDNIHGFYPEPKNENEKSTLVEKIQTFKADIEVEDINFLKSSVNGFENHKTQELLDKTILRAKHHLPIFKDSLIHFSVINSPLASFKPFEINLPLEFLKDLGYFYDIHGNIILSDDQEILLQPNDIIVPEDLVDDILHVMAFINDELTFLFNKEPLYDLSIGSKSIIGSNVIGINKNYSVGMYGRIIGFSNAPVCYASPIWHLSKGSYCNGEMTDSFVLDFDCLLNLDLSQIISKVGMFRGIPIFTQIEPDPDISSSIIEKYSNKLALSKLIVPADVQKDTNLSIKIVIKELLDYNRYNKLLNFYDISNLTKLPYDNALSGLTDPIERLDFIFSHTSLLGTIIPNKIFNMFLQSFLSNDMLPVLKAFYQKPVYCPACGFRNQIPMDSKCSNCKSTLSISESLTYLERKFNDVKKFIEKFDSMKVNEITQNLLLLTELQFSPH